MKLPKRILTLNSGKPMKSIPKINKSTNQNMVKSKESPASLKRRLRSLPKSQKRDDHGMLIKKDYNIV